MLDNIKHFFIYKTVDKDIKEKKFDLALNKLNMLIKYDFRPYETYLKRGMLFAKLLMYEEAYSDLTYVVIHTKHNNKAIYEKMKLCFEMGNYIEAISDADKLINELTDNQECIKIKFISLLLQSKMEKAKNFILNVFSDNKYQTLKYLFDETAKFVSTDELSTALKILEVADMIDKDNPLKIFNEANIYNIAKQYDKERELLRKLEATFPKYFVSHFRFSDIYEERDILEVNFLSDLKIFDKQNTFEYPMYIIEGYKHYQEGHILDSKMAFEKAIEKNPNKPEGYVLLAQTLQLMSGYDNPMYKQDAEKNYNIALELYQKENLTLKVNDMKRQLQHLNSTISF